MYNVKIACHLLWLEVKQHKLAWHKASAAVEALHISGNLNSWKAAHFCTCRGGLAGTGCKILLRECEKLDCASIALPGIIWFTWWHPKEVFFRCTSAADRPMVAKILNEMDNLFKIRSNTPLYLAGAWVQFICFNQSGQPSHRVEMLLASTGNGRLHV